MEVCIEEQQHQQKHTSIEGQLSCGKLAIVPNYVHSMKQQLGASYPLLENVHLHLQPPTPNGRTFLTRGKFKYFHYNCDGHNDIGWGCAYRTLQTACSWIEHKQMIGEQSIVPTILEIQRTLVELEDKPADFYGSRDWIGALEVFYVIESLYDVPCKILHVPQREDVKKYASVLKKYFEDGGGVVMMGGDEDASSKGIAGLHISGNQAYFLVIDPHYVGRPKSAEELIERGYVRWQHTSEFVDSSFYNLCLPQT